MFDGMRFTDKNEWEVFVKGKFIGSFPFESVALTEFRKERNKYCSECQEEKPVAEYRVFYTDHLKGWIKILCLECMIKLTPRVSKITALTPKR